MTTPGLPPPPPRRPRSITAAAAILILLGSTTALGSAALLALAPLGSPSGTWEPGPVAVFSGFLVVGVLAVVAGVKVLRLDARWWLPAFGFSIAGVVVSAAELVREIVTTDPDRPVLVPFEDRFEPAGYSESYLAFLAVLIGINAFAAVVLLRGRRRFAARPDET